MPSWAFWIGLAVGVAFSFFTLIMGYLIGYSTKAEQDIKKYQERVN